jgi:hypothetical protein
MNRIRQFYLVFTTGSILFIHLFSILLSGCASLIPDVSNEDPLPGEDFVGDTRLQMVVDLTLERGTQNTDYNVLRKYLELDFSEKGSVDRIFFEIELTGPQHYAVFFLENKGSVYTTNTGDFPENVIERIRAFYGDLQDDQRNEYLPVSIRQYKIMKRMKLERTYGGSEYTFSTGIIGAEKYTLYGLLHLEFNSFMFFGMTAEELGTKDYLEADSDFRNYIELFLTYYGEPDPYLL